MRLKFDDILFFIVIALIVFVALWLLKGSPTLDSAIVSVGVFVATSEILLWRKYFELDKKTAVSFERVRSDLREMNNGINNKLSNIERLIKTR